MYQSIYLYTMVRMHDGYNRKKAKLYICVYMYNIYVKILYIARMYRLIQATYVYANCTTSLHEGDGSFWNQVIDSFPCLQLLFHLNEWAKVYL